MMNNTYSMPAEWAPHEAILITWPHNERTWPGKLAEVQQIYLRFIAEIASSEQAWVVVRNDQEKTDVLRRLILANVPQTNVRFYIHPNNDAWIRDYGPIFLKNAKGERRITDWQFNGWGGKYQDTENYTHDDLIPLHIASQNRIEYRHIPFILEGGSIEVNGKGTLITSKSCLLNDNRNNTYTLNQIEDILRAHLGIKKVIWVDEGIAGDDTDGHIDDTVRFVNENTVICAYEANTSDENHAPLHAVYQSLLKSVDQDGSPLRVIKLPMPEAVYDVERERLPASYANFLILNTKVLVPVFGGPTDSNALAILQELFPSRRVIGIPARELILGFGSLHCLSQQVPA